MEELKEDLRPLKLGDSLEVTDGIVSYLNEDNVLVIDYSRDEDSQKLRIDYFADSHLPNEETIQNWEELVNQDPELVFWDVGMYTHYMAGSENNDLWQNGSYKLNLNLTECIFERLNHCVHRSVLTTLILQEIEGVQAFSEWGATTLGERFQGHMWNSAFVPEKEKLYLIDSSYMGVWGPVVAEIERTSPERHVINSKREVVFGYRNDIEVDSETRTYVGKPSPWHHGMNVEECNIVVR